MYDRMEELIVIKRKGMTQRHNNQTVLRIGDKFLVGYCDEEFVYPLFYRGKINKLLVRSLKDSPTKWLIKQALTNNK